MVNKKQAIIKGTGLFGVAPLPAVLFFYIVASQATM